MPDIRELPPEEQAKYKRAEKIARLRWLQKQYRMMENGASERDVKHLKVGQQVLENRIEILEICKEGGR